MDGSVKNMEPVFIDSRIRKQKGEQKMTEQEQREEAIRQSDMWKAAIEKSLQEVQELRERLDPVKFESELWDSYH